MAKITRGLVLGKFLPPHRGHQFLIDFGRGHCDELTVMVCSLTREPIPGVLRYEWVRQLVPFGNVRVVHVADDALPQTPEEHPEFWRIWKELIGRCCPEGVDYFFASEEYGNKVAEVIGGGCRYVEVDPGRELVPVSGTMVRGDPMRYWEYLTEPARGYFLKRVCVFGPESTGKSTLARDLAREFKTVYAWEYARPLLDPQGGQCFEHNIPEIVRGQVATEEALARQANRVLFCDTDVLTTTVWSEVLFGRTPGWIRELAERKSYDLYLLMDVDVPWVSDGQRFFGEERVRREMFERFRGVLEERGRRYVVVRGDWENRLRTACDAVREIVGTGATAR